MTLSEIHVNTVMLALAKLALERPGWDYHICEIADLFEGRDLFESLKRIHGSPVEAEQNTSS